jgi:hypothetical protein
LASSMPCCSVDVGDMGIVGDAPTVATVGGGDASAIANTRGDTSRFAGATSDIATSDGTDSGDAVSGGLASGSTVIGAAEGAAGVADATTSATGTACDSDCASDGTTSRGSSAGVDGVPSAAVGAPPASAGAPGRVDSECAWNGPRKLTRGVPAARMRGEQRAAPKSQGTVARKDREASRESLIDADSNIPLERRW